MSDNNFDGHEAVERRACAYGMEAGRSMTRWGVALSAGDSEAMRQEENRGSEMVSNVAQLIGDNEEHLTRQDCRHIWNAFDVGYFEGRELEQYHGTDQ